MHFKYYLNLKNIISWVHTHIQQVVWSIAPHVVGCYYYLYLAFIIIKFILN